MATVTKLFLPADAIPPATNYATTRVVSGSNFPVDYLDFDAATDEAAIFRFLADRYGSGNLTVDLFWVADNASSGDVIWGTQIAAITPDADSQDVETKAFATANTVTDSHLGTTGQRLHKATITVSNLDSLAAGDLVWLKIYRDADAGGDTMANDASLVAVAVSYSDT